MIYCTETVHEFNCCAEKKKILFVRALKSNLCVYKSPEVHVRKRLQVTVYVCPRGQRRVKNKNHARPGYGPMHYCGSNFYFSMLAFKAQRYSDNRLTFNGHYCSYIQFLSIYTGQFHCFPWVEECWLLWLFVLLL